MSSSGCSIHGGGCAERRLWGRRVTRHFHKPTPPCARALARGPGPRLLAPEGHREPVGLATRTGRCAPAPATTTPAAARSERWAHAPAAAGDSAEGQN